MHFIKEARKQAVNFTQMCISDLDNSKYIHLSENLLYRFFCSYICVFMNNTIINKLFSFLGSLFFAALLNKYTIACVQVTVSPERVLLTCVSKYIDQSEKTQSDPNKSICYGVLKTKIIFTQKQIKKYVFTYFTTGGRIEEIYLRCKFTAKLSLNHVTGDVLS